MRAKRSKKYRKIMSSYNLHFSFRTPYQVLCSSDFLRQCHAFSMPVQKSLENTLHGDAKPYITQCSLAAAIAEHKAKHNRDKDGAGRGRGDGKPLWLPPPLEVPLRYCKHKDAEGADVDVLSENECLVDLIGGQPKGNEVAKNKNHYVLATAEREEDDGNKKKRKKGELADMTPPARKRRKGVDVREAVRQIAGTPIVYVKRSVMVLEELSGVSERVIRGTEKAKFKEGLVGDLKGVKRKREDGEDSDGSDAGDAGKTGPKAPVVKRAKGPNPLSMRKKKVRQAPESQNGTTQENGTKDESETASKKRRRRKHGKKEATEAVQTQPSTIQISAEV